ncbi:MAG TPA: hypothetical protein VJS65_16260 [Verrucomicrobiae bacterium]|nr:hypothetical protein [Verrucomicrobiae bacterium]
MKVVQSMSAGALLLTLTLCTAHAQTVEVAPGVLQLGTLQNPNVTESSGAVSSRRLRGTFWTHNDEGPAVLYSFSTNGVPVSEWDVDELDTHDWEDTAWSGGRIYIADIGNNHGQPGDVYLVAEPNPRKSGTLRVLKHWKLEYPDDPFDSESFFVSRGAGYIIEKENGNAHVYRFKLSGRTAGQLEEQCSLNTDALVTGADITRDNKRLAVITDTGAYLFPLPKPIPSEGTLEPSLFVPYALEGMEGCTFTRDGLLVTAESGQILLFTDPQFRAK